jgi:hypothetical protein
MPRLITQADIDHVWHTYESIHGVPPLTQEEVERGVKVLLRAGSAGSRERVKVKIVSGRNITHFIDQYQFNVNLQEANWRDIVRQVAWRCDGGSKVMERNLARRACEGNFLVGALKPVPVVVVKPTKEEARKQKIERLEARLEVWQRKQDRAKVWIRKINRSLNAYRRFEK